MNATNSFVRFTRSISALSISISFQSFSEKAVKRKVALPTKAASANFSWLGDQAENERAI